jgi:uncharacterized protein with HEPN domain
MPKHNSDLRLYIHDILDSAAAIQSFMEGMPFEAFKRDRKTYSATIREYTVIGEAIFALRIPLEAMFPSYEWRMIKDFRNFIVHEYFGVDPKVIWDITQFELPELVSMVKGIQQNQTTNKK